MPMKEIDLIFPQILENISMENIVTVKELAGFLKLTEATIYKLALRGSSLGLKSGAPC